MAKNLPWSTIWDPGLPGSEEGHRAMEAWALGFCPVGRWGVEEASGLGRHTAAYLAGQSHDVRTEGSRCS